MVFYTDDALVGGWHEQKPVIESMLVTLVEIISRLSDLGYYLNASPVGDRNFLFVSGGLVRGCFAQ